MRSFFQEIDLDEDGEISRTDVAITQMPPAKVEKLFAIGDTNRSGRLTFAKWITAMRELIEEEL